MGFLASRIREVYAFKGVKSFSKITRLAIVSFLISVSIAAITTIWAVYANSFFNDSVVTGYFLALLSLVSFVTFFFIVPIVEKYDKAKLFIFSLIVLLLIYIVFMFSTNKLVFIILAFVFTIFLGIRATSFGLLVKDSSDKQELAENEGLVYTFLNTGWVVGPLLAGVIVASLQFKGVFALAVLFSLLGLLFFSMTKIKDPAKKGKIDGDVLKNCQEFFKDKDRLFAYAYRMGVAVWWAFVLIFIPLYIKQAGLSNSAVGYFIFAVTFPLLLFEYRFSKIAERKGFRRPFVLGFSIVALLCFVAFFVSNIYFALGLLVLASVGMAMVEPTSEAYFFDVLKRKEDSDRFYGPFNTSVDAGGFLGRVLASSVLFILPFKSLFLFFAGFMLVFALLSFRARRIVEARRK